MVFSVDEMIERQQEIIGRLQESLENLTNMLPSAIDVGKVQAVSAALLDAAKTYDLLLDARGYE